MSHDDSVVRLSETFRAINLSRKNSFYNNVYGDV